MSARETPEIAPGVAEGLSVKRAFAGMVGYTGCIPFVSADHS